MSHFHVYMQEALQLISAYSCSEPLAAFVKKKLAADRRKGSRDRKRITDLCYRYFRIGRLCSALPEEERMRIAIFLTAREGDPLASLLDPDWSALIQEPTESKLRFLSQDKQLSQLFPYADLLSHALDPVLFDHHLLYQPAVYIRIRPSCKDSVIKKLNHAGVPFTEQQPFTISVSAGCKIEELLELNREAVIQDLHSQKILSLLDQVFTEKDEFTVWDCCAASGGKSIQLVDLYPLVKLTVTDKRSSMIANLHKRFSQAGISGYKSAIIDLQDSPDLDRQFDLLMTDVPCSGSGTWARTPEQLTCFEPSSLESFVSLQKKILTNAFPFLKKGGFLLYSTCSAFAAENEEQVRWMEQELGLQCLHAVLLDGTSVRADTMYAALLQKQ